MNAKSTGKVKFEGKAELQDENIWERTSVVSDLLSVSTAQSPSFKTTIKSSDGEQTDKETVSRKCDKDAFDVYGCTQYTLALVRKKSPKVSIMRKMNDILKDLPLCLHVNGSVVHIEPRSQMCCNGVVNRTTDHEQCCGETVIDDRRHLCCNNSIYTVSDFASCCGMFVFGRRGYVCCNDSLHSIQQNLDCYVNMIFKNTSDMCCNGNIQPVHGLRNENDITTPAFNLTMTADDNKTILVWMKIQPEGISNGEIVLDIVKYSTIIGFSIGGVFLIGIGVICSKQNGHFCKKRMHTLLDRNMKEKLVEDNSSQQIMIKTVSRDVTVTKNTTKDNYDCGKGDIRHLLDNNESLEANEIDTCTFINEAVRVENGAVCLDGPDCMSKDKSFPDMMNVVLKQDMTKDTNLLQNYVKVSYTQTGSENFIGRRTIFGQKFQHTFMLDEVNPSLIIPDSDVSLTLPKSITKNCQVEVNCSSFNSLPDLRKKLGLSDDEVIASPVAEFVVTGCTVLQGFGVIVLPFVGKAGDLIVRKFKSDEGLSSVATSVEIPERTKENVDLDLCYTIQGSSVIVYTKSFSGFYCTKCRHKKAVDLSLRVFIFGSYKRINQRYEVGLSTYIADEIFELKAYQERMLENEVKNQERVQLKDIPLRMQGFELDDQDHIEAFISLEHGWKHRRHPTKNRPIQEERKEIRLEYIAQKCKHCPNLNPHEVEIPFCTEWYLTTVENITPSEVFQCTVDLNICKKGGEMIQENSFFIEELKLRSRDRLLVKEVFPTQETNSYSSDLVRGERSLLLEHSFSESDLRHQSNRNQSCRQKPHPELSALMESDRHQGLK